MWSWHKPGNKETRKTQESLLHPVGFLKRYEIWGTGYIWLRYKLSFLPFLMFCASWFFLALHWESSRERNEPALTASERALEIEFLIHPLFFISLSLSSLVRHSTDYRNRRCRQLWGVVHFERIDRQGKNRKNERNCRIGVKAFLERGWLDNFCERLFKEDILLGNFARQPHSISFYVQKGSWRMVTASVLPVLSKHNFFYTIMKYTGIISVYNPWSLYHYQFIYCLWIHIHTYSTSEFRWSH